jgi:bacterioferritin-associated ferredoxin
LVIAALCPAVFDGHVTVHVAGFFQTLMECGRGVLRECVVGRIAGEEPITGVAGCCARAVSAAAAIIEASEDVSSEASSS